MELSATQEDAVLSSNGVLMLAGQAKGLCIGFNF